MTIICLITHIIPQNRQTKNSKSLKLQPYLKSNVSLQENIYALPLITDPHTTSFSERKFIQFETKTTKNTSKQVKDSFQENFYNLPQITEPHTTDPNASAQDIPFEIRISSQSQIKNIPESKKKFTLLRKSFNKEKYHHPIFAEELYPIKH